jgi:hypothetical protein
VTQENEPVVRSESEEKGSRGDSGETNEITILDYVMLDFVDASFAPRKDKQRWTTTES